MLVNPYPGTLKIQYGVNSDHPGDKNILICIQCRVECHLGDIFSCGFRIQG